VFPYYLEIQSNVCWAVRVACIINLVGKTRGKTLLGTYGRSWRRILKPALEVGVGFVQKIQLRRFNTFLVGNFASSAVYKMGIYVMTFLHYFGQDIIGIRSVFREFRRKGLPPSTGYSVTLIW